MKHIITYLLGFGIIFVLGFSAHQFLLAKIMAQSPIDITNLYLFFGIFSFLLCVILYLLSKTEKFKDQLGFLYLVSVVLKIVAFSFVFSVHIFSERSFSNQENANLLIPMVLNILLEVFFMSKILNNTTPSKNAI